MRFICNFYSNNSVHSIYSSAQLVIQLFTVTADQLKRFDSKERFICQSDILISHLTGTLWWNWNVNIAFKIYITVLVIHLFLYQISFFLNLRFTLLVSVKWLVWIAKQWAWAFNHRRLLEIVWAICKYRHVITAWKMTLWRAGPQDILFKAVLDKLYKICILLCIHTVRIIVA